MPAPGYSRLVGLLGGDPIPWRRWWLPAGTVPTLFDGLLPEPDEEYTRYLNRDLALLEHSDDMRARVLLADAGMGKSTELHKEVDRLRSAGQHAALIELGAYASTGEIRSAIDDAARTWQEAGSPGDLLLVLDAFDEPLVDVVNLNDVLAQTLARLEPHRLRVMVASRGSLWRESLHIKFVQWWGADQVVVLQLAPLTAGDVVAAAVSEGVDGDRFVSAVRAAGAGPLMARPITLRLMLAGARDGQLPANRVEAYGVGVAGLVDEPGERRRERRRTGTPLDRRLSAARRLASASLLSGRPNIVRRARAIARPGELALDEVAVNAAELEALEDVLDSALLSGTSDARVWCHHSVAEYLCAQALAALPVSAAWSLLAAPGDPSTLRPQLEETAAWTAVLQDDMFDRLLDQNPRVLVKGDLAARSTEDRERVTRALLTRLAGDEPVLERGAAVALDYSGVEDDLRPLLAAGQPHWRRREAVTLIAAAGYRGLDRELLDIVQQAAGRTGYGDEVALAVYAAHALAPVLDPQVADDMRALAAIPAQARAALVTSLFPTHLSAGDVASVIPPDVRWVQPLGRTVVHAVQQAVDSDAVQVADALAWFGMPPDTAYPDERARRLAAASSLAVIQEGPTSERWPAAVDVAAWLLRGQSRLAEWSPSAVDALGPDRRRELARALLLGRADAVMSDDLVERAVLRAEDLPWWLDRLEEDAAGGGDGGLSAELVARALAGLVLDDEEALATARKRCGSSPTLASRVGAELAQDTVDRRRQWRTEAEQRRRARESEQASFRFSQQRLDDALVAGDLSVALEELERSPAPEDRPPGPNGPTSAWTTAELPAQQRTARLAADHLVADQFDLDDDDDVHRLGLTVSVAAAGGEELADVPAGNWSRWLPALLRSPSGLAAQLCLKRALEHDADSVADVLEALLVDQAAGRGFGVPQGVVDGLPLDVLERLAARGLALAGEPDVPPDALSVLLAVGNAGRPPDSAQVALQHVEARGTAPADGPRRRDDPEVGAWLRAVAAARALIANPGPHDAFNRLLGTFRDDPGFAVETVRSLDAWQVGGAWKALSSEQLAELYLWAKQAMPSRNPRPGVVVNSDRAEELPDDLLGLLTNRADGPAVSAMRCLADATGNVYLRESAERLAAKVAADADAPPSARAVLEVVDDPGRRAVTSRAQLAQVVLEALDALAEDYARDRGLRRRLWEKQRSGTRWSEYSVPAEETRVSQELKTELAARLRGRVAVAREVEIQPALGTDGADRPDVLAVAVTTDTAALELPLEVKGNYNADVIGALTTQLADRYLTGPVGDEGVYVVAYFDPEGWDATDKNRRQMADRHSPEGLRQALTDEATAVAGRGMTVHVRVIEVPLGSDDGT